MLTLTLPWPPRALSPNQRTHWRQHASAKARFRAACALQARAQGVGSLAAEKLAVGLVFVPPDRRRRDLDNLIAAMKAGLDGLADVLGVDDSRWKLAAELAAEPAAGGFARVEVTCLD